MTGERIVTARDVFCDAVRDAVRRLCLNPDIVDRAEGHPDPGKEEPEVVVDLGDGADGALGFLLCVFCSMEIAGESPSMASTSGLLHEPEELAGVCGERFDIPSLSFGVDGIECQCGLAGAGKAGNDDELIAGELDGDIFEVMLSCPPDRDLFHGFLGIKSPLEPI